MPRDWTREEVIITVNDYFDMFIEELAGRNYNKSEHRRELLPKLNDRTEGAIEYKHQNISAVLIELGLRYISGYKPRHGYQNLLKEEVINYLINHPDLEDAISRPSDSDISLPNIKDILHSEVDIPEVEFKASEHSSAISYKPKRNYYKEELKNRRLGLLGEEFVITYEKQHLSNIGLDKLANQIEHVSQTKGDSAGFDVLSFDENGNEKLIEVKTTQMGKEAPFYFTRNELSFSREQSNRYRLYRVFEFKKDPRFYQLKGALDETCESISTEFMGWPR